MQHRIGAYLRVSTEEQAQVIEGSLDSQKHRLHSFVELKNLQEKHWGKIIEIYSDEGLSAKDTKRPALQRMLTDLRLGKINLILVTDLSRLSRNILDFCLLLEDLKKHNGKFLSVKEQFDTTTAAGEMMVFNMINLSQFERKQVAERVSMNFHSRAMRGLLNGGPVILGYDKNPANPAQYIVNDSESNQVREIFRIFLEEGSILRAVRRLNESGITKKVGRKREHRLASKGIWTLSTLRNLLENKSYVGIREVNKKYKSKDLYSLKPWQQHQECKASWPAIITDDEFNMTQKVIQTNRALERPKPEHKNGSPFILTGRIKCADCGAPFIGETGHGRISDHRYYGHKQYQGVPFICPVRRFPAELAEEAVEQHLAEIALNPKEFKKIEIGIGATFNQEIDDLRNEKERLQLRLLGIDQESHKVFQLLGDDMGDAGLKMVKEKIASLGEEKTRLGARLTEIDHRKERASQSKKAVTELEDRIVEFKAGWTKGTFAQKKRLIRAIIDRLEVSPGLLGLFYLVPQDEETQGPKAPVLRPDFSTTNSTQIAEEVQNKKAAGNHVFPAALGSSINYIGVTKGT
jgi:site-specific DNA recombinase